MGKTNLGKTSLGMQAELEALLCYALGFITGIIFYILEKENKFVRFHAMQSLITFGGFLLAGFAISIISWMFALIRLYFFLPLFGLVSMIMWLGAVVLWIVLMVRAYQGEKFKLPMIGDIAEKNA
ncbi:MAG: DUF4870 domain-containing protein [Candidatus Omnitrophica bacterium]|nr:DUF4870 domain-containing protein [Candidatus Omnitrophota bacterium]